MALHLLIPRYIWHECTILVGTMHTFPRRVLFLNDNITQRRPSLVPKAAVQAPHHSSY